MRQHRWLLIEKACTTIPNAPSELETIFARHQFSGAECARARVLRECIVAAGLSKYNVGYQRKLEVPNGVPVILVPGQVEDDTSIELGCRDICTNVALLQAVREQNPGAFILYKPHPDVVSGNRMGRLAQGRALAFCNQIEHDVSLVECLNVSTEVHTMTSLVGFEAFAPWD